MSDKHLKLLPTPWLSPYDFEEFVERLLWAQRHLGADVRRVAEVERWGTSGDKQDGIDLVGKFSDGVSAAWQCKHLVKLRPFEVRGAVEDVRYEHAEEFYLVFSRVASTHARAEMKKHPGWTLVDRRRLTRMLMELPAQVRYDVLDETWGEEVRRLFLKAPGDAFVSIRKFAATRRNPDAVMNDLGPLVGRENELAALAAAFDRSGDGFRQVLIVSGPAGRGKSRLVTDALSALQERQPEVPVVCLSAGHRFEVAAMKELRMGPMVVLVDDAHVDPPALAPLLVFARDRHDVQLVLATRPSATSGLITQTTVARFGPSEQATVDVGVLAPRQAQQLVTALTNDMKLSFPLKSYLAEQAEHSPFVAVITANLIKRGELTASLAVDPGLRDQVLSRYQDFLGANVPSADTEMTQRVLATYAALGQVNADDKALRSRIADFCGLKTVSLARLLKAFCDRGVLVEHGDVLRVVPDVLADHVLEVTAAFEDYDSGFVAELWDTFGADHHYELALSLGELDWRLAQRGGPRVMANVWATIRDRVHTPHYGRLMNELGQLEQLAATQPAEVLAILEEVRIRLDREDASGVEPPEDENDGPLRKLWGRAPPDRDDVRAIMPNLYARAAVNDPDQLESALDAFWAFRRRDGRPAYQYPDHPARMVEDYLANLATLPHPSFPQRIVARVGDWLTEPRGADDTATPLFALEPLLAKEGIQTVQSGTRQLGLQPHTFDATKIREVRDQIRELLYEQALSDDLRRAGEALDLLHDALRQPHGYFGQTIDDVTVLQWEDDDLATLQVFDQVANKTTVPAVRRRIHEQIAWSAEHAVSLRVQHTALTLVARLNRLCGLEDDVADQALNNLVGVADVNVRAVSTLEELEAERMAERERLAGMTDDERQADKNLRIHDKVEAGMTMQRELAADVARQLLELGDIPAMLDLLDQTARAVQALLRDKSNALWGLWRAIADQSPEHLETIVWNLDGRQPGPLDQGLNLLVTRWLEHSPDAATGWVQNAIAGGRREVKMELARGFSGHRWHLLGDLLTDIWATGVNDPDPDISQAFLAAAGTYVRDEPAAAVEVLLAHDISPFGAKRAIEDACEHDGRSYGAKLDAEDAAAILRLISRAGYDSYAVQETVTGIATAHPRLVLNLLAKQAINGVRLPNDIHGLNTAFEAQPDVFATWICDNLTTPHANLVIAAAVNGHLTHNQATALAQLTADLDSGQILSLVDVLARIDTWALDQPNLAHSITIRAREAGIYDQTRPRISDGLRPHQWGTVNGVSDKLNEAAARAENAANRATDPDLKADYEAARDHIQAHIDELRREQDNEDNNGW